MTNPTNNDLSRALGQVEGTLTAVKDGLERIEMLVRDVDNRLKSLEADKQQRKGALAVMMTVSGIVGGLITKFGAMFFGGVQP